MIRNEEMEIPEELTGLEARVWQRIGVIRRRKKRARAGVVGLAVLGAVGLGWWSWTGPGPAGGGWPEPGPGLAVVEEILPQEPWEGSTWVLPVEEVTLAGVF